MNPTPVSITLASGRATYRGKTAPATGRPAWRTAMAANTWTTIPGNTLAAINPELSPSTNANYPSPARYHAITGFTGVVNAWNGAVYDYVTSTWRLPKQGGHGDWAGSENYDNCIKRDTCNWRMVKKPAGWDNSIILDDGQEASGLYANGEVRPGHTYNNNIYVPGMGSIVTRVTGPYVSGSTITDRAYLIDDNTGAETLLLDYASYGYLGYGYGGACYDPTRNCIWLMGTGTAKFSKINLTGTKAITPHSSYGNNSTQYCKLIYLAGIDAVLVIQQGGAGYPSQFYLWDVANGDAQINLTVTGSFSAGLSGGAPLGQTGADWDAANQRVLLWDNTTNTTEISTLTPSGNPRTAPWTAGKLTVSGSNTVTPTVRCYNGTYGRFVYDPILGGCALYNAVDQQNYFFATE